MPIGDLLAEISGEPSSPKPALAKAPLSVGIKRKASESSSLSPAASKKPATAPNVAPRKPSPPVVKPVSNSTNNRRPESSMTNGHRHNGPSLTDRAISRPSGTTPVQSRKPAPDGASRPRLNPGYVGAQVAPGRPSPSSTKPSPMSPAVADPSRAPKKGSFAEIMARGAKAQQSMGKVGVIQHKAIDKQLSKKERELAKLEEKNNAKAKPGKPFSGSGKPSTLPSRDTARPSGSSRDALKSGSGKDKHATRKTRPGSSGGDLPEKKVKKSAMATTGYTGTARPVSNASKRGAPGRGGASGSGARHGGLLAPPKVGRSDRYDDEYDEDMDDFIDDDEEEDVDPYNYRRGAGYGYDSEGSSDMEAGMSDIDNEERRADKYARDEDKREQALEQKLKREKEERKRQYAQGYR